MAVITAYASKPEALEVLSLSEKHYVLRRFLSFIDLELIVCFRHPSKELCIDVSGPVLRQLSRSVRRAIEQVSRAHNFNLSEPAEIPAGEFPPAGIFDFRRTWFQDLPTNDAYEGGQTRVKPIDPDERIEIYGCAAIVPTCSIQVRDWPAGTSQGKKWCRPNTIRLEPRGGFKKGAIYALRLGFWTSHPKYENPMFRFYQALQGVRFKYSIDLFRYGPGAAQQYAKNFLQEQVGGTRLWVRMPGSLGPLVRKQRSGSAGVNNNAAPESTALVCHSDIWLVTPSHWRVASRANGWVPVGPLLYPPYDIYKSTGLDTYRLELAQLSPTKNWLLPVVGATPFLLQPTISGVNLAARFIEAVAFLSFPAILLAEAPRTLTVWPKVGMSLLAFLVPWSLYLALSRKHSA